MSFYVFFFSVVDKIWFQNDDFKGLRVGFYDIYKVDQEVFQGVLVEMIFRVRV